VVVGVVLQADRAMAAASTAGVTKRDFMFISFSF
jgi:hypothetical protein